MPSRATSGSSRPRYPASPGSAQEGSLLARELLGLFCVFVAAASLLAARLLLQPFADPWLALGALPLLWVVALLGDPLLGLATLPALCLCAAGLPWWRLALTFACNSLGEVALLSMATLSIPPEYWGRLRHWTWRPGPEGRRRLLQAAFCMPSPIRALFALVTELAFLPALLLLLLLEKLLVDLCGGSWHWPAAGSSCSEGPQGAAAAVPCIVLLHGSGINECQWAAARHLLHLAGFPQVVSVNYLEGFWHTEAKGMGLPEFAAVAAEQIRHLGLSTNKGSSPKVVLVGHSLGGLVAAYLLEHSMLQASQLQVSAAISVSGPLKGSVLLARLHRHLPQSLLVRMRTETVLDSWMLPDSLGLQALRKRMSQHPDKYRLITGQLDIMVRPESALCCDAAPKFHDEHRLLLPHLHHYNIAGSALAWAQIADWISEIAAKESS